MSEFGLVEPGEIDDPKNSQRLAREEVRALGSVLIGSLEIGAWSRAP